MISIDIETGKEMPKENTWQSGEMTLEKLIAYSITYTTLKYLN